MTIREPKEETMFFELTKTLVALRHWLEANQHAATRHDLIESENRIIVAIQSGVDPSKLEQLDDLIKSNTEKMQSALVENTPLK